MKSNQKNEAVVEGQSPLAAIPHPSQILDRITRNNEETKILWGLYKLARKVVQQRERESTNA